MLFFNFNQVLILPHANGIPKEIAIDYGDTNVTHLIDNKQNKFDKQENSTILLVPGKCFNE